MALKACVYQNCQNYVLDRVPSDKFTLFQFPKNAERRQKWMELGKAPTNLPLSSYYYCSDHFDKRFLSVNNRRTMLVGEALPFPCISETTEPSDRTEYLSEIDETSSYEVFEMKDDDKDSGEQELHVGSTMEEDDHGNIIGIFETDFYNSLEKEVELCEVLEGKLPPNKKKRNAHMYQCNKRTESQKIISPHKIVLHDSRKTKIITDYPSEILLLTDSNISDTNNIDIEFLVNKDKVTTFIFKGEEFVQMPKEYYINEKTNLLKKIENMERLFKSIKSQIDNYDIEKI